ncbi:venom allergen 3-like isoform X2 [Colletes gigas]|uniref:venom allergen 3-like isoform X2 n=1 Tax=Colletes gigas TaxID=935657 RepID=UPI001C9AAA98|nr:venom allergen 3-like isoform X2 [Colletes gigas]
MATTKSYLFAVLITAYLTASNAARSCGNYSNLCSGNRGKHTLCLYPNPAPASTCVSVLSAGLTQAEKDEIVDKHNELRQRVASGQEKRGSPGPQPAATNMQNVSWDDELAEIAQRWANQCEFGHDTCRDVARFSVGQNVGITMTTGTQTTKPSDIVVSWYNEVEMVDRNLVTKHEHWSHRSLYSTGLGEYEQNRLW